MKKLITHIVFNITVFLLVFTAMPAAFSFTGISPVKVHASEITPRADVIYWRYRTLSDGTIQKRRWNETKGYWVDPHWINVN